MNEVLYARANAEWDGRVGDRVNYAINVLYLTITKINYELSTNIISKASNFDLRIDKKSSQKYPSYLISRVILFSQFILPNLLRFTIDLLCLFKYQGKSLDAF